MITIRKAKKSDLVFYFELRNEPSVRKASFNSEPIDIASHTSWFLKKLKDPNTHLFVAQVAGKPAGQIRIDIKGATGEASIALLPEYRGKGYASPAIYKSCKRILTKIPNLHIVAYIKLGNIVSVKSFARAGFAEAGISNHGRQKCIKMTLYKSATEK